MPEALAVRAPDPKDKKITPDGNDEYIDKGVKADVLTGDFAAGLETKIREAVQRAMPADLRGLITAWRTEYGDEYVRREASRALMWLDENGKRYTDMARFIGNWLRDGAKTQDAVARRCRRSPSRGAWIERNDAVDMDALGGDKE